MDGVGQVIALADRGERNGGERARWFAIELEPDRGQTFAFGGVEAVADGLDIEPGYSVTHTSVVSTEDAVADVAASQPSGDGAIDRRRRLGVSVDEPSIDEDQYAVVGLEQSDRPVACQSTLTPIRHPHELVIEIPAIIVDDRVVEGLAHTLSLLPGSVTDRSLDGGVNRHGLGGGPGLDQTVRGPPLVKATELPERGGDEQPEQAQNEDV